MLLPMVPRFLKRSEAMICPTILLTMRPRVCRHSCVGGPLNAVRPAQKKTVD